MNAMFKFGLPALVATGIFAAGEGIGGIDPTVGALVSTLGPVGFMVWYCWYVTTRTIPDIQKRYDETIQRVVTALGDQIKHQTEVVELMSRHCAEMNATAHGKTKG
jgi:hypothetical protein